LTSTCTFVSPIPPPPQPILFPYTTLFRSNGLNAASRQIHDGSGRETSRPACPGTGADGQVRGRRRSRDEQKPERPRVVCCRQGRSEEHTSELQSPDHLVCRLLLEKKKQIP